jgi:6-phosphogluconolactonase (cycloisomerase 2 family)
MKSLPRLFAAVVLSVFVLGVLAGCSGMGGSGGKTLTSIAVTPASPAHLKVGSTQQFTATGTFSDGSTSDISSSVTWNSGTAATATISASGLATGVAAGTTAITASQGMVTSSPSVTLTVIALQSIAITAPPAPISVAVAGTVQFTATGTYTDASTADVTSQATWAANPTTTVATFSTTTIGLATGVANGTAQITATIGTIVSPPVTLKVGTGGVPVPVAVVIVQANPTIPVGGVEDFTAQFKMSDGTLVAPTAAVAWSSGTAATASIIANSGVSLGLAQGTSLITATSGTLTPGTTTLTVVPAVPRSVYAAGFNDVAAASYVVNSSGSTLTPTGVVRDTTKPAQIVPSPNGKFAYGPGANGIGSIALYTVDPKTGALTFVSQLGSGLASIAPFESIMDTTGRFIYIVNSDGNVVGLATNTTSFDGSLTPLAGSPYAVGSFPIGIAEDPAGKFVYVTNLNDGTVSAFKAQADGSLAPLTPASNATVTVGSLPGYPAVDSSGAFLYVPNSGDGTISAFQINSTDGSLTAVAGSPFDTGAGNAGAGPTMVAVLPSGKFLYVTDGNNNKVIGMTITNGALSAPVPNPAGILPQGLAIDPSGAFLVAANQLDNTLTYYTINGTTGALTVGKTVETRIVPNFVNIASGIAAPTIAAATVEAANMGNGAGTGSVSSYTLDASGALTAAASSPKATLDGNNQGAVSASGKFFYTATSSGKKLQGFSLDAASAGLTALPNPATNLSPAVPGSIYAEIGDQFVYVADTANAAVLAFNTNPTAGITANVSATGLTSVNAIAGDPQGQLIYALGSGQLQPVLIDQGTGNVAQGVALPQAGNWTAGAIDPSGRFLVAADSAAHKISSFTIQPVSGSTGNGCSPLPPTPPDDGCIGLVPSSTVTVGTSLNGPYAVTFDPLGRFVFVADQFTGSVAVFTFDSSTGLTAAAGTPVVVDASGVTNVAVDANGKFLYVGIKGNGTTTAGKVAVYTIGSGGTLTAGTPVNAAIGTSAVTITNSIN